MNRTEVVQTRLLFFIFLAAGANLDKVHAINCSQCDTKSSGFGCLTSPPEPTPCGVGFNACLSIATYSRRNYPRSFQRGCIVPFPAICKPAIVRSTREPVRVCYWTCQEDGCNQNKFLLHSLLELFKK